VVPASQQAFWFTELTWSASAPWLPYSILKILKWIEIYW
jgi:hypothetical protein